MTTPARSYKNRSSSALVGSYRGAHPDPRVEDALSRQTPEYAAKAEADRKTLLKQTPTPTPAPADTNPGASRETRAQRGARRAALREPGRAQVDPDIERANDAMSRGFGGLAELSTMQAERKAGVAPGTNDALQTGGLGERRSLESDAGRAERMARRYLKKFGRAGAQAASGLLEAAAVGRMNRPGVVSQDYRQAEAAQQAGAVAATQGLQGAMAARRAGLLSGVARPGQGGRKGLLSGRPRPNASRVPGAVGPEGLAPPVTSAKQETTAPPSPTAEPPSVTPEPPSATAPTPAATPAASAGSPVGGSTLPQALDPAYGPPRGVGFARTPAAKKESEDAAFAEKYPETAAFLGGYSGSYDRTGSKVKGMPTQNREMRKKAQGK